MIFAAWHIWLKDNLRENATGTDAFLFYNHLCKHRPDLLRFRCLGDRWQRVHGWLLNAGLVSS